MGTIVSELLFSPRCNGLARTAKSTLCTACRDFQKHLSSIRAKRQKTLKNGTSKFRPLSSLSLSAEAREHLQSINQKLKDSEKENKRLRKQLKKMEKLLKNDLLIKV